MKINKKSKNINKVEVVQIRMPKILKERLEKLAERKCLKPSSYARMLLIEAIEREEKKQ